MSAGAMRELLGVLTEGALLREAAVILFLCLAGGVFLFFLGLRRSPEWLLALSFPAGLSLFTLSGFFCLLSALPFTGFFVSLPVLLAVGAAVFYGWRDRGKEAERVERQKVFTGGKPWLALLFLGVFLAAAGLSLFRAFPMTIDNDSVYYYSVYPETLVREGRYLSSFDTFLTDVGPLSAVLNCLPFFYGFDNTIGVQTLMNLSFLLAFGLALKEEAETFGARDREPVIAAILGLLFLLGSMPFWFMAGWVMSNAYFMELLFLTVFLAMRRERSGEAEKRGILVLHLLFLAMCAGLRVEGSVMAALVVACLSLQEAFSKRMLLLGTAASALGPLAFSAVLYCRLGVDPLYSFLDLKKSLMTLGVYLALALWIAFFRDRVLAKEGLAAFLPAGFLVLLLLGNLGLCFINSGRYLSNLKTFLLNIRLGNGWGIFGFFFGICVLLMIGDFIRARFQSRDFYDLFFPALLLTTLAVCWARGGLLRVGVGDSGNRVLMQCVPFAVLILARKVMGFLYKI